MRQHGDGRIVGAVLFIHLHLQNSRNEINLQRLQIQCVLCTLRRQSLAVLNRVRSCGCVGCGCFSTGYPLLFSLISVAATVPPCIVCFVTGLSEYAVRERLSGERQRVGAEGGGPYGRKGERVVEFTQGERLLGLSRVATYTMD